MFLKYSSIIIFIGFVIVGIGHYLTEGWEKLFEYMLQLLNLILLFVSIFIISYLIQISFGVYEYLKLNYIVKRIIKECEQFKLDNEPDIIMQKILGEVVIFEFDNPFKDRDFEEYYEQTSSVIDLLEKKGYFVLWEMINDKIGIEL